MFTEIVTEINRQRASRIVRGGGGHTAIYVFPQSWTWHSDAILPDYNIMSFENNDTQRHSINEFDQR